MAFDRSEAVADEVRRRVAGRHVLLLTDFDGTLAELAPTPAEATIADSVREPFDALCATDAFTVGVVSGRRLDDVRARIGPGPQFVAGLHGLEIAGPGVSFVHPDLEAIAPIIRSLMGAAADALAWCDGLLLEDKTYALTCHVRLVDPEDARVALEQFASLAEPQLEAGTLRLLTGSRAFELLPSVDWHKGRAVEWIRGVVTRRVGEPVPVIYLGDDRTDEDAFDALHDDDLAIGVGPRPHTHLINWRLTGPASTGRFFAALKGTEVFSTDSGV